MGFRPMEDYLVVKRGASETKTPGGLYIPDSAAEKVSEGEVTHLGPRYINGKPVKVKIRVGDKVVFDDCGGTSVQIDGEEHVILGYKYVLGVRS